MTLFPYPLSERCAGQSPVAARRSSSVRIFLPSFSPLAALSVLLLALLTIGGNPPLRSAEPLPPDSTGTAPSSGPVVIDTILYDASKIGTDALLIFSAPARFDGSDWGLTAGAVLGTGLLQVAADEPVREEFGELRTDDRNDAAHYINSLGSNLAPVVLSGTIYLSGLIFDAPSIRVAGRHVFQAALYAGLTTAALKALFGRHRPELNNGAFTYEGPTFDDPFNSLPSGHATLAFAMASSLAADIDESWATVGLYGAATAVGVVRGYHDRHWSSDVFLGAAIGTAFGYGVAHLDDPEDGAGGSSLYFMPMPNGVMVGYVF